MLPTDRVCDLPESIIIWEILTRLPPKAVLRCRAVCMSWCRLTSTREFVLAHHRNQPLLPIFHFYDDELNSAGVQPIKVCVPDLEDAILRPIIRCAPQDSLDTFAIHAACDGLLLISLNNLDAWQRRFHICNPATRQRATLRKLVEPLGPWKIRIAGLYPHRASGVYRVLYWTKSTESSAVYHVLTLGSDGEPRCIGCPTACESVEEKLADGLPHDTTQAPVLLRGSLHWYLRDHGDIMVFDTVAETFGSLRRPPAGQVLLLFELAGTLAMICSATTVDLWLLQDYEAGLWSFKHRIDMSALSDMGDRCWDDSVLLSGDHNLWCYRPWRISYSDIRGYRPWRISFCDIKGKREN